MVSAFYHDVNGGYVFLRRILLILLVLLLLCGCGTSASSPGTTVPAQTDSASTTHTETAPEATDRAGSGPDALSADTVLFYRQADFEARRGTLIPLETVRSASEEELLPRTHLYDERFPGDGALLLRLLDYAFAQGYQGFSVLPGTVPVPDAKQYRALAFAYWIDGGSILSSEQDGCLTFWHSCEREDEMEKFSLGLAAARELAARIPRGDDWETASWIFSWLAENVGYGDRTPYYFKRGHMLYDALVEKDCLCSGYANAMYYLCNLCGVECLNVYGLAQDPETPGGLGDHLWNYVRIYGTWYVCDPTANTTMHLGVNVAFALSFDVMQTVGGNKPTGEYTDSTMLPACEAAFDPVSAWNATPEGALRSWLWFGVYDAVEPVYLLMQAGLMTPETEVSPSADGMEAVLDIPYADYAAWADRFMSPDAQDLFPVRFSEAEGGGLIVRKAETDNRSDWLNAELRSVSAGEDGVYTADLGTMTVRFTVSQTEEGLYRVETVTLS